MNNDSGELDYAWQAYDEIYFPSGIKGRLSLTRVDIEIGQFNYQLGNED
ncbi:MAG: hypothetical protein KTR16_04895 [Acidiferrobacterales bacterium]|nr:hypothetical protein [Acidiferrobacterales bacterium]